MMLRYLFLLGSALVSLALPAAAQLPSLTPDDEIAHKEEANLWLDLVFGHCLSQVSGETWSDHPAELQGEWVDLRPDYSSTLLTSLYDPKESTIRGSIIFDLSPGGESCWSQYSSLVPDYAFEKLNAIRETLLAEDRLKTAFVDQGYGAQQVEVILAGEDRIPVIFYQSDSPQAELPTVITILQRTEPDFVYND